MTLLPLSPLSWVALAVMALALAAALSRRFLATGALLVANLAVFLLSIVGPRAPAGPEGFSAMQAELSLYVPNLLNLEPLGLLQFFSSMFVHADALHILGNMIFLWAFGMPFEERIGARRFVAVYLASGAVGALAQIVADGAAHGAGGYLLGASAAIFGVMCAFAAKYPNQVIAVPVPLLFVFFRIPMRVIHGALLWIGYNLLLGLTSLQAVGGVAYFAHLGGGLAGALFAVLFLRQVAPLPGRGGPIAIDLAALGDFARDVPTKDVLAHMRQNHDEAAVFQAWLDRFFRTATCPTCSHRVMPRHRGEIVCTQGHAFDVRQDRREKLAPVPGAGGAGR